MKEIELDKYVGKRVELIDFQNKIHEGSFYKIENGRWKRNGTEYQSMINNGYVLDRNDSLLALRKSHIKKIRVVGGK